MFPSRALLLPGLPILALSLVLPASSARATCDQVGMVVTCDADDTDGFVAGANNLDVTVEAGVTVSNPAAMNDTIDLDDTSTLLIEATGTVTAEQNGRHAVSVDNNNDDINNQGSISTTGTSSNGIAAGNDNVILNDGTILVGGDNSVGISGGTGSTVTTNGAITATGAMGIGIMLGDDADVVIGTTGGVLNSVVVDGTIGVQVGNAVGGDDDGVTNDGAIVLTGSSTVGIDTGDGNLITNNGGISVSGDNSVASVIGIRLGDDNELINDGSITASGMDAVAVQTTGATATSITNNTFGMINAGTDGGAAIDLTNSGAASTNTIFNDVGASISGPTTAILGGPGVEMITNDGSVTGDIDLGGGNDMLTLGTSASVSGMLLGGANTDALNLLGTGTGSVNLDNVMGFESLTIGDVDNDGIWFLQGAAAFSGLGATLANGTLQLQNTTTITGAFTAQMGSTINVVLDPVGDVGRLDVIGAATLDPGVTLSLLQTAPIPTDTTITFLTATGGIGGTLDTIPADTTLLDFELLMPDANTMQLQILRTSYGSVASTPNQSATATYLDRVLASGGNDMGVSDLLMTLDTLSAGELRTAYDRLHPESYDVHTGAMASQGRSVAKVALRPRLWCKPQMFELDPGPHRDAPCGDYTAWIKVLLSDFDRDAGSDFFTSSGTSRGVMAGLDVRPHRRVLVTLFGGLTAVDFDVDDVGDGDIETFEMGAAVQANLAGLRGRAAFGYGRGEHEQNREVSVDVIESSADGKFDSDRIHALVELAYLLEWGGFQLEPVASLDVTHVMEDAFEETSGLGLGLAVEERENTIVSTQAGARLRYRIVQPAWTDSTLPWLQGVWTPEISAQWRGTWSGADREIDASLNGASAAAGDFTVESEDSEQGVEVESRLSFQPHGNGGSFSLWYDGYFGDAGTDHRFGGSLEVYF